MNGVVGLLATGGSTNHTMHLIAMASAAGIALTWEDLAELSRVVPLMARVYPNGKADVNHFNAAGGMSISLGNGNATYQGQQTLPAGMSPRSTACSASCARCSIRRNVRSRCRRCRSTLRAAMDTAAGTGAFRATRANPAQPHASGTGAAGTYDIVAGAVTNIKITNAGGAYTVPPTVTFTSGGVTGATATAVLGISPNYYQPTLPLLFTGGGGTGAAATVNIMPIGISGSAIETYAQRAWIVNTNKIFFTAASSPSDFSTSDGGGIFTSSDSFLKASYINLFQSNEIGRAHV